MRVRVAEAEGSTPRERGAAMIVNSGDLAGTIGGGRLEWDAIDAARAMLAAGESARETVVSLGPGIGQCCGGRVTLLFDAPSDREIAEMAKSEAAQADAWPHVMIYGAGHVGRALARALSPMPFQVALIDARDNELARAEAPDVVLKQSDAPVSLAEQAPDGAAHVVMTHSHALDSLIAAAVLERGRFRYLGIIGSKTKRASFRRAFRAMGFQPEAISRVTCPIGGMGVRDKRPEVIAALAAAEITRALLSGD
jgi:xanthine dehydrogenase accessory factor